VRERIPLLGGLALIAVAFVIGAIAIGHGIRDRNQNDVIVVTGSAKQRITSDYVIWTLSVTSTQPSATDAAKELSDRGHLERRASACLPVDAELRGPLGPRARDHGRR
jgi:hypothetical protein